MVLEVIMSFPLCLAKHAGSTVSSEVAGWQPLAEWVGPADLLVDWSRVAVAPEDKGWLYLVIHSSPPDPLTHQIQHFGVICLATYHSARASVLVGTLILRP